MVFASILFSSFWSLITVAFSTAGIRALHKTDIPISDTVKLLIDFCIALSVNSSLVYAFVLGPIFPIDEEYDCNFRASNNSKVFINFFLGAYALLLSPELDFSPLIYLKPPEEWNSIWDRVLKILQYVIGVWVLHLDLKVFIFGLKALPQRDSSVFSFLEMYPSHLCWIPLQCLLLIFFHESPIFKYGKVHWELAWLYFYYAPLVKRFLVAPYLKKLIETSSIAAYVYEHRRITEIAFGLLATTVAQYYFRVQSVALMLAFLSLALAWLGTLAIVQPCTDAGIFEFLVSSSIQSAVSLFGLHFYTFLVFFGGILLWFLRLEMKSIRKLGQFDKTKSWEEMAWNKIDSISVAQLLKGVREAWGHVVQWGENWKMELGLVSLGPMVLVCHFARIRDILRLFSLHISNNHANEIRGVPRPPL